VEITWGQCPRLKWRSGGGGGGGGGFLTDNNTTLTKVFLSCFGLFLELWQY
jgi:hypothetical protein